MWRTMFTRVRAALCCLLLLATLLLVTACGGYSSPGGSPQGTPTKGSGYSILWLFDKEFQFVEDVLHRVTRP